MWGAQWKLCQQMSHFEKYSNINKSILRKNSLQKMKENHDPKGKQNGGNWSHKREMFYMQEFHQ